MPGFKRKRPKNARSGCLLCKGHKMNGYGPRSRTLQERRQPSVASLWADYYYDNDVFKKDSCADGEWEWFIPGDEILDKHEVSDGRFSFGDIDEY